MTFYTELSESTSRLLRERCVETARLWIDTPYKHQASLRGAGCDCLGLVRGVWRTLYGAEPLPVPSYTPNWAEETGEETLLQAAKICLRPCDKSETRPGDVLLFRMSDGAPVKHIAIMSAPDRIIHAYWGRAVVESYLVPFWIRRWSHSFSFPEVR